MNARVRNGAVDDVKERFNEDMLHNRQSTTHAYSTSPKTNIPGLTRGTENSL